MKRFFMMVGGLLPTIALSAAVYLCVVAFYSAIEDGVHECPKPRTTHPIFEGKYPLVIYYGDSTGTHTVSMDQFGRITKHE